MGAPQSAPLATRFNARNERINRRLHERVSIDFQVRLCYFQGIIDRTRGQINLKRLRTIFGVKKRPHRNRKGKAPRLEAVIETPQYDLTVFKLHFGKLTLKIYTKGERVLRVEAIVHNTQELRCGRRIERFPKIVSRLRSMAEGFLNNLYCLDTAFITDGFLEQLPTPSRVGETRVGGVDISKPRMRTVLSAVLALACSPNGFTVSEFAAQPSRFWLPSFRPVYLSSRPADVPSPRRSILRESAAGARGLVEAGLCCRTFALCNR